MNPPDRLLFCIFCKAHLSVSISRYKAHLENDHYVMYNVDRIIKMTFEEQFPNDPFLHFGYQANPENRSNKDSDISNWNSTSAKEIESGSEKAVATPDSGNDVNSENVDLEKNVTGQQNVDVENVDNEDHNSIYSDEEEEEEEEVVSELKMEPEADFDQTGNSGGKQIQQPSTPPRTPPRQRDAEHPSGSGGAMKNCQRKIRAEFGRKVENETSNHESASLRSLSDYRFPWFCGQLFQCEKCPRQFLEEGSLKLHSATIHKTNLVGEVRPIFEKKFQCVRCRRELLHQRTSIRRHVAAHGFSLDSFFSKYKSQIETSQIQLPVTDPLLFNRIKKAPDRRDIVCWINSKPGSLSSSGSKRGKETGCESDSNESSILSDVHCCQLCGRLFADTDESIGDHLKVYHPLENLSGYLERFRQKTSASSLKRKSEDERQENPQRKKDAKNK